MADALAALGIGPAIASPPCCPTACPPSSAFSRLPSPEPPRRSIPATATTSSVSYLEDTNREILLCPPDGAADARKAAEGKVPVYSLEMDAKGFVRIVGAPMAGKTAAPARRHRAGPAHQRQHRPAQARADPSRNHRRVHAQHRRALRLTPDDVSLCAMPLFHVHGLVASTFRRCSPAAPWWCREIQPLSFWRTVRDCGVTWYSAVPTIHQLLLSRAGDERPAGAKGCASSAPAARRSLRK
jgi:hypothetical protein